MIEQLSMIMIIELFFGAKEMLFSFVYYQFGVDIILGLFKYLVME